ncbi:hypothetical protein GRI75_06210 [Altererythrobacter soli]|uniref:Uncharacterized protein n=1 Tax=Croceibacterium soli TaxID=1739690 RepID=A0A6I4UW46_9SPHN|nr:hypothetical protein [Croceibacterium soli]MXP41235.1 hypothetical protein [Croceibacterium soli]
MSETLELPSEPGDFADQEAAARTLADGKWISASEALDMVSQGRRDEGEPGDAICFRAENGEVRARARRWITIENGRTYEWLDELIPRDFWCDRDMRKDWSLGDFKSTIYLEGAEFEVTALGVTFELSDIEAISGALTSGRSLTVSKRGRPKGSGGHGAVDAIIVEKMRQYLSNNPGKTVYSTAGLFAGQAAGGGCFETKQRRLCAAYKKAFPS